MLMCYELMQYELMCYVGLLQLWTLRLDALKYCVGISTDDWWIGVFFFQGCEFFTDFRIFQHLRYDPCDSCRSKGVFFGGGVTA